jgi:hypothetical protein
LCSSFILLSGLFLDVGILGYLLLRLSLIWQHIRIILEKEEGELLEVNHAILGDIVLIENSLEIL